MIVAFVGQSGDYEMNGFVTVIVKWMGHYGDCKVGGSFW